jgi:AcrR family transcriptional regulator
MSFPKASGCVSRRAFLQSIPGPPSPPGNTRAADLQFLVSLPSKPWHQKRHFGRNTNMNTGSRFDVNPLLGGLLPAAHQRRSRITTERFVDAALELLQTHTFEDLSVAELARRAGRSVGAFYQRFGSKDDFLASLLITFMAAGERSTERLLAEGRDENVIEMVLTDSYESLMRHHNLWHAALRKSAQDPGFWAQFQSTMKSRPAIMAARLAEIRGHPLKQDEVYRLRIALQVFNSVINNQMMNNPGPLALNTPEFLPMLLRIFRTVYAADFGSLPRSVADR